ncbi:zinc-binding dehydrogenase [Nonomuraea sp. NPDC003707]
MAGTKSSWPSTRSRLRWSIAATYPLERVQDAFRELEKRHTRGKIILKA